jgi:hypothetical protein
MGAFGDETRATRAIVDDNFSTMNRLNEEVAKLRSGIEAQLAEKTPNKEF